MSKKNLLLGVALLGVMLTGCGETSSEAKLTGSYLSPSNMVYSNMRPTYNYYTLTFSMQNLKTFDDGTYELSEISQCYSALILPESGSAANGNERENKITTYYGTFTSETNALDSDMLTIKLSEPTRIIDTVDASYYFDTANWTQAMSEVKITTNPLTGETKSYADGETYLSEKKFSEATFNATISTSAIEYVSLTTAQA